MLIQELIALNEDSDKPKLTAEDGRLHLNGKLLIVYYDSGDVDTLPWPIPKKDNYWNPEKWRKALVSALYDEREMGNIPSKISDVILPDGNDFTIGH